MASKKNTPKDWAWRRIPTYDAATLTATGLAAASIPAAFEPLPIIVTGGLAVAAVGTAAGSWAIRRQFGRPTQRAKVITAGTLIWAAIAAWAVYYWPDFDRQTIAHWFGILLATAASFGAAKVGFDWAQIGEEGELTQTAVLTGGGQTTSEILREWGDKIERHDYAAKYMDILRDLLNSGGRDKDDAWEPELVGLKMWPEHDGEPTGLTMQLRMPKGKRKSAIEAVVPVFGEEADLESGCVPSVAATKRQNEVLLNIPLINPQKITVEHPRDWSPLTVNGPVPLAVSQRGEPLTAILRQSGIIYVGPPGTGKTNMMHCLLGAMARCNDVLVWGIDIGKGGHAFRDWTVGLPEGARPLVTRVASTVDQALELVQAAQRLADDRIKRFSAWQQQHDATLVPVGPDTPMIFLAIDEAGRIFNVASGDRKKELLKAAILALMETTREAGIRTILSFTDGNVTTMGSTDIDKYSPIKIGLIGNGVAASPDAAVHIVGSAPSINYNELIAQGLGVGNFGNGIVVMRGHEMKPSINREATVATSGHRPVHSAGDLAAIGDLGCPTATGEHSAGSLLVTEPETEVDADLVGAEDIFGAAEVDAAEEDPYAGI